MPSHPDRVRQNYCEHGWKYKLGFNGELELIANSFCVKCGISWDKVYRRKVLFITNPNSIPDWIRKQFVE